MSLNCKHEMKVVKDVVFGGVLELSVQVW